MNGSTATDESAPELLIPKQGSSGTSTEPYLVKVFERTVPFSDFVSRFPKSQIPASHLSAGLAASFTTTIDNPFFKLPTALDERNGALPAAFAMYAPYYIGTGFTPDQIANDVAAQAANYLKALDAVHGYDGYVGRMMAILRNGYVAHQGLQALEDRNILYDVHDFLALITNRLHHVAPVVEVGGDFCSAADVYRAGTHEKVDPYVRTVSYQEALDGFHEQYQLPKFIRSDPSQLVALGWDFFETRFLRRGAEFAALAAEKLGNPIVRSALSEHYIPAHARSRDYLLASY